MAEADSAKPFSPDEIQKILHHLQQPAVFMNMTLDWPALQWTAEQLSARLGDRLIRFRLARKEKTNSKNQKCKLKNIWRLKNHASRLYSHFCTQIQYVLVSCETNHHRYP